MPLNLPDRLPAIELLKEENIFVIDNPGFRTDTAWHTVEDCDSEFDAVEDYYGDGFGPVVV